MKNWLLTIFLFSTITFVFISCERDDICAEATQTSPFLIIKFVDFVTGIDAKIPEELQIKAVGIDTEYPLESVGDSIAIPLRLKGNITEFEFTINSNIENNTDTSPLANTDLISFQYTLDEQYISSACGFKVDYIGLTTSPIDGGTDDAWIKNITIQRENITDETAAHVYIFH